MNNMAKIDLTFIYSAGANALFLFDCPLVQIPYLLIALGYSLYVAKYSDRQIQDPTPQRE